MRIASKLLLSYVGIAAIAGITALTAYAVTSLIASSYSKVSNSFDETIQPAADVQVAVRRAASSLQLYFLLGNQEDKKIFLDRLEFATQRTQELSLSLNTDQQKEAFNSLESALKNIEATSSLLISEYDRNPAEFSAAKYSILLTQLEDHTRVARSSAGDIANLEAFQIKQDATHASDLLQSSTFGFIAFATTAVGIAIIIALTSSRSITKPLKELSKYASEIAKGNFDFRVEIKQKDELGLFAAGFERMQAELKEKERIKDEFVKVASHEIGAPIVPILLNAEALEQEIGNSNPRLQAIVRSAKRAHMLTSILLDISRIDSGTFQLLRQPTNVLELARQALEDYEFKIRDNPDLSINIVTKLSDKDTTIEIDRARIYQVMYNLLDNAFKFTESGSITIEVFRESLDNLVVKISDTGKGISKAMIDKLFERYATDSPDRKGTGLGLYLSKMIVKAHGGKIWGENNVTGGASFYFALPAKSSILVYNETRGSL